MTQQAERTILIISGVVAVILVLTAFSFGMAVHATAVCG